jgi:hypothetical protein
MLIQFLVELICKIKCQKKVATNVIFSKTKANNCYLRPILDIMFQKWFPLFEVPSPRTTTLEKLVSLAKNDRLCNNEMFH